MVYLVSYDLRHPGRDYTGLYSELQRSPVGWWHYLESTGLISTTETLDELLFHIRPHIDDNDSLLVIEVMRNYQGWLLQEAWDWIGQQVFRSEMV